VSYYLILQNEVNEIVSNEIVSALNFAFLFIVVQKCDDVIIVTLRL